MSNAPLAKSSTRTVWPIICRYKKDVTLFPRPILCSASLTSNGGPSTTLVVGSADHSLKVLRCLPPVAATDHADAPSLEQQPLTLHTKQYGHSEWVTTCAMFCDGRVVSGGMDGRVCLWDKDRARCTELAGGNLRWKQPGGKRNTAARAGPMTQTAVGFSVSKVKTGVICAARSNGGEENDSGYASMVFAASYDGAVRGWKVAGGAASRAAPEVELRGVHGRNPVVNFVWSAESPADQTTGVDTLGVPHGEGANRVFTGGKDSKLGVWDVETGKPVVVFTGTEGPVEHLAHDPAVSPNVVASAGRGDGRVLLWDVRDRRCASKRNAGGAGSPIDDSVLFLGSDGSVGEDATPALVAITTSGIVTIAPQAEKAHFERVAVPAGRVTAACLSRGHLFAGYVDGCIRVVDIGSQTAVAELVPWTEASSDGRRSAGVAIRCISVIQGGTVHRRGLRGCRIYAGDDDGELRLWSL